MTQPPRAGGRVLSWVVLLFVTVPLLELYLLLLVGRLIGFWPTVAVTLLTGVIGGTLAKREGLLVYRQWRRALDELRPPETGIIEGLLVLVGGALLLTPGVLTDIAGLLLMFRPTRRRLAARLRAAITARFDVVTLTDVQHSSGDGAIDTTGTSVSDVEAQLGPRDEP